MTDPTQSAATGEASFRAPANAILSAQAEASLTAPAAAIPPVDAAKAPPGQLSRWLRQIAANPASHTGHYLRPILNQTS